MNSPMAELIHFVHGLRDSKFFLTDLENSIQYSKFHDYVFLELLKISNQNFEI